MSSYWNNISNDRDRRQPKIIYDAFSTISSNNSVSKLEPSLSILLDGEQCYLCLDLLCYDDRLVVKYFPSGFNGCTCYNCSLELISRGQKACPVNKEKITSVLTYKVSNKQGYLLSKTPVDQFRKLISTHMDKLKFTRPATKKENNRVRSFYVFSEDGIECLLSRLDCKVMKDQAIHPKIHHLTLLGNSMSISAIMKNLKKIGDYNVFDGISSIYPFLKSKGELFNSLKKPDQSLLQKRPFQFNVIVPLKDVELPFNNTNEYFHSLIKHVHLENNTRTFQITARLYVTQENDDFYYIVNRFGLDLDDRSQQITKAAQDLYEIRNKPKKTIPQRRFCSKKSRTR